MDDIYENIEEYNQNTERQTLIVFDDQTADTLSKKKLQLIANWLFIRSKKLKFLFILLILFFCTKKY